MTHFVDAVILLQSTLGLFIVRLLTEWQNRVSTEVMVCSTIWFFSHQDQPRYCHCNFSQSLVCIRALRWNGVSMRSASYLVIGQLHGAFSVLQKSAISSLQNICFQLVFVFLPILLLLDPLLIGLLHILNIITIFHTNHLLSSDLVHSGMCNTVDKWQVCLGFSYASLVTGYNLWL